MAVNHSQRYTVPIALALALVITPALSGCFANPIEQIVEGATGGDVSLPGQSIPADFPAEVPLYDGEVTFGLGLGNTDGKAWNVTIRVPDIAAADDIKTQLEGAGFTQNEAGVGGTTADGATLIYANATYTVLVVVTSDANGFVANYTVSQVAQ